MKMPPGHVIGGPVTRKGKRVRLAQICGWQSMQYLSLSNWPSTLRSWLGLLSVHEIAGLAILRMGLAASLVAVGVYAGHQMATTKQETSTRAELTASIMAVAIQQAIEDEHE